MRTSDAITAFGSKGNIAKILKLTPAAISRWGGTVPPLRAYQLREILDTLTERERAILRGDLPRLQETA